MIPSAVLEDYFARPLDDHRWMKQLEHRDLDRALAALRPRPWIHPDTRLHQKIGIYLGIAYPQFSFWYDMGTGKTLISLTLLKYWWDTQRLRRGVIFLTSDKAFPTWEKQIKGFGIEVPHIALDAGGSEARWNMMNSFDRGLILVPYPGAVAMNSRRVKSKAKGKKFDLKLDPKKVQTFAQDVDAVIWDESTRAAGHDSLTHRLCRRLSRVVPVRYALAGRPFGRDPTPLWTQQFLVDRGATFGETLELFRAAFFNEEKDEFSTNKYARNYHFDQRRSKRLNRMIQHRSLTYRAEECIDLPSYTSIVEEVRLPTEARAYYKRFVDQIIAARGNLRETKNAFLRMRQISSGFLGFRDDESGEKAEFEFPENPKLDLLLDLLSGLPSGRKAVIFYEFTRSGRLITQKIKELGLSPIWLWSGTTDPARELNRFTQPAGADVAVCNNRISAYSLDGLQIANYSIFFESPVSPIDREQAERRVRRQGQTRKSFQYDLVVKGTMDQRILDFHAEGEALFEVLLANPERVLK